MKFHKLNSLIIFFSVLAISFFIPHPLGRKLSMVLNAAFGFILKNLTGPVVSHSLCCNLRAVHKLSYSNCRN